MLLNGLFLLLFAGRMRYILLLIGCVVYLFYAFHDEDILISDNAQGIYNALPKVTFAPVSIEDFKVNGYFVSGSNVI